MVSWTMRTARSLSSAGRWCPDPCLGVCCFDADMGYILPKNAASIKPRAVHCADLLTARFRVRIPAPEPVRHFVLRVDRDGRFRIRKPPRWEFEKCRDLDLF